MPKESKSSLLSPPQHQPPPVQVRAPSALPPAQPPAEASAQPPAQPAQPPTQPPAPETVSKIPANRVKCLLGVYGNEKKDSDGIKLDLRGHVGFDGIPDQIVNKATESGFHLNLLVVGHTACGKSSLLNTLFKTKLDGKPASHSRDYIKIDRAYYHFEEKNVKLNVDVSQTVGLGDQLNQKASIQILTSFVDEQYELYLRNELNLDKSNKKEAAWHDTRIHVCFYCIQPCAGNVGLKTLDAILIKELSARCNVIPIITKSETLTQSELKEFKHNIQADMMAIGATCYDFSKECGSVKDYLPFAVICSDDNCVLDPVTGKRVRKFRWGSVDVESEEKCDMSKLREVVIRLDTIRLINKTKEYYYAAYRHRHLTGMGFKEHDYVNPDIYQQTIDKYSMKIDTLKIAKKNEVTKDINNKVLQFQKDYDKNMEKLMAEHNSTLRILQHELDSIIKQQKNYEVEKKNQKFETEINTQLQHQ